MPKKWSDLEQYGTSLKWFHDRILRKTKRMEKSGNVSIEDYIKAANSVGHLAVTIKNLTYAEIANKKLDMLERLVLKVPASILAQYIKVADIDALRQTEI